MKKTRKTQRKRRIRAKIFGTKDRPRLSVFRSNKFIYAQLIDDEKSETLVATSEGDLRLNEKPATRRTQGKSEGTEKKTSVSSANSEHSVIQKSYPKIERANLVGEELARKAKRKRITGVVFDRAGYRYHGRVRALAEGARKGGLKF
ncbi:50S ribosomal protein L18 [Patescibacteria group bacterium]|nr:50S ribosomal protein L18 [Patescibacteria group bacterium]